MSFTTRRIHFLRHGLADRSAFDGHDDRQRPLTAAGCERMEREAAVIADLDLGLDVILTSPLVRCRQTAEIVAEALDLAHALHESPLLQPGFGMADLDALLAPHADCGSVLLVGHEPDFSQTVSRLTGGSNLLMKKGGLARVDLSGGFAGPKGELVWLLPPRLLAR